MWVHRRLVAIKSRRARSAAKIRILRREVSRVSKVAALTFVWIMRRVPCSHGDNCIISVQQGCLRGARVPFVAQRCSSS